MDPSKPPSKWIEPLKVGIAKYNTHDAVEVNPSRIIGNSERLVIIRTEANSANLYIPRSVAKEFGVTDPEDEPSTDATD